MSGFTYSFNLNCKKSIAPIALIFDDASGEIEIASNARVPSGAFHIGSVNDKDVVAFTSKSVHGKSLRTLQGELDEAMLNAVNRARQLMNLKRRAGYCGCCGTPTKLAENEAALRCPRCGELYFPRVDPAIIVGVRRGDSLLLAHNSGFANQLYGLIAGFVEGGESIEAAVMREVREEVGIAVKNVRYFGSQFWPFPNSLMLGCFADYDGGEIHCDGVEITDAGFFRRDNLPTTPGPGSVARRIIDAWIAEADGLRLG